MEPGLDLPTSPLIIAANDGNGGLTSRRISIVLCGCTNNGSCIINNDLEAVQFDLNGHYKWPCSCPEFFGGDSCEVDMRGCGDFSVCPSYSICSDDDSVPSGYNCDTCLTGYEIDEFAMSDKCTGIKICVFNDNYCI